MKNVKPIWEPQYRVTTDTVRCLMDTEVIRAMERMKRQSWRPR